jgi:hypothetical protein
MLATFAAKKPPSVPTGLPTPSTDTTWRVLIAERQWKKVAEAIKNPEDILVIEGWATISPEPKTIMVYATNATTKLLQAAAKEKQRAETAARNMPTPTFTSATAPDPMADKASMTPTPVSRATPNGTANATAAPARSTAEAASTAAGAAMKKTSATGSPNRVLYVRSGGTMIPSARRA